MEKLVKLGILFDFYGKLLSQKQFDIVELYYMDDLSLAEIAEELEISRQAVFDTLKRAEDKLNNYEDKLKLVEKFYKSQESIIRIKEIAEEIKALSHDNTAKKAQEIEDLISEILL